MGAARGRAPTDPPFPRAALFPPHDLGTGRLEPGLPNGRAQKVLRIDVTGARSGLIGRLLVGSYITGQDQVLVTARGGLTATQRAEVHRVVDRLLGMSVVGDSPSMMEVQNFVDPGKYELPRLLHRLVEMLRYELGLCHAALVSGDASELERTESIEEEIDQLYLLMARQLLLSSDDPRVARDIDVQSHHFQIGYRLVAKVLEVTGDLVHSIGTELRRHLEDLRRLPPSLTGALALRVQRLDSTLSRTMSAFTELSVVEANETLNRISELLAKDAELGPQIARRASDRKVAMAAQRIVCNLVMAMEMLIIVNEVTINRGVEPETVARTGTKVVLATGGTTHASADAPPGLSARGVAPEALALGVRPVASSRASGPY